MGFSLQSLGKKLGDIFNNDVIHPIEGIGQGIGNFLGGNHPQIQPPTQQQQNTIQNINQNTGGGPVQQPQMIRPPQQINPVQPVDQTQNQTILPAQIKPPVKPKVPLANQVFNTLANPVGAAVNAVTNPAAAPIGRGIVNSLGGVAAPVITTAENYLKTNPVTNAALNQIQQHTGKSLAENETNFIDQHTGTSLTPKIQAAQKDPLGSAAQAALLTVGTPLLGAAGTVGKVAETGIGGYFAAQGIKNLPSQYAALQNMPDGPKKTEAITEFLANLGMTGAGTVGAVHGAVGLGSDLIHPTPNDATVANMNRNIAEGTLPETTVTPKPVTASKPTTAGPIYYHGSPTDFSEIKAGADNGLAQKRSNLYLTTNPEVANLYKAARDTSVASPERIALLQRQQEIYNELDSASGAQENALQKELVSNIDKSKALKETEQAKGVLKQYKVNGNVIDATTPQGIQDLVTALKKVDQSKLSTVEKRYLNNTISGITSEPNFNYHPGIAHQSLLRSDLLENAPGITKQLKEQGVHGVTTIHQGIGPGAPSSQTALFDHSKLEPIAPVAPEAPQVTKKAGSDSLQEMQNNLNSGATVEQAKAAYIENNRGATAKEANDAYRNVVGSVGVDHNTINSSIAPPAYEGLGTATNYQDVRDIASAAEHLPKTKTEVLATAADRLFGKKANPDKLFLALDGVEHPEAVETNAAKLGVHSVDLQNFVKTFQDTTDFAHSLRTATGNPVAYAQNHSLHPVDLTDRAAAEAYQAQKTSQGTASHQRSFQDLRTLLSSTYTDAAGNEIPFKLKDQSVGAAIREYGRSESSVSKSNALINALKQVDPTSIHNGAEGAAPKGYKASGIPGLGTDTFLSPKAYKETQGFRAVDFDQLGTALKTTAETIDKTNKTGKQASLFGGGFHGVITTIRQAGESAINAVLHPTGAVGTVNDAYQIRRSFWDPKFQENLMQDLNQKGWLELADRSGLTGSQASDLTTAARLQKGDLHTLNPYAERLFNGRLETAKLLNFKAEAERLGVTDPRNLTTKQLDRLSGVADAQNNRYGGINLQTINRNPIVQWLAHQGLLAPDFFEGKIRTVASAIDPRQSATVNSTLPERFQTNSDTARGSAAVAQKQLVGTILATAVFAEVGRRIVTGQGSQSVGDAVQNDVLDPSIPLPYQHNGKNLIARLPSDIAEGTRAVSDPGHYIQARTAFVPSVGAQAITGKDYYGNDLVDKSKNPDPSLKDNLFAALKSRGPIPVEQAMRQGEGKQGLATSIINSAGGRVGYDPNDPKVQQQTAYFSTRDDAKKSLDANGRKYFDLVTNREKDAQGNSIKLNDKQTLENNQLRAKHPEVVAAETAAAQAYRDKTGQPIDPLYDLTPKQQADYYQMEGSDYKGQNYERLSNKNKDWLPAFQQARSDFFAQLPPSTNPNTAQTVQYPLSKDESSQLTQYFNETDSGKRAQIIQDNPGIQDSLNKLSQYTNDKRKAQGYDPIDTYPTATPQLQKAMKEYNSLPKNNGSRTAWIRSNPQAYKDMTQYLTKASVYGLEGEATQAQYQDTGLSQKALKDIVNLGKYDISTSTGPGGVPQYALNDGSTMGSNNIAFDSANTSGGSSGSGYKKSSKSYVSKSTKKLMNSARFNVGINSGMSKGITATNRNVKAQFGAPKVTKAKSSGKVKLATKSKSGSSKLSIKPSKV